MLQSRSRSSLILKNVSTSGENHKEPKLKVTCDLTKKLSSKCYSNKSENLDENEKNSVRTAEYNIIPLPLIMRFFEQWYYSFTMLPSNFQKCAEATSFSPTKYREFLNNGSNNDSSEEENNYINLFFSNQSSLFGWSERFFTSDIRGNFFVGPRNRAPFHSRFDQSDVEALMLFDFDSESILEQEHYQELLSLFKRLINYVAIDSENTSYFETYTSGIEIYFSMMRTLGSYETRPLNINQWEERTMTEEELSRFNVLERNNYRGRKFWAIRKNFKRSKRSVKYNQEVHYSLEFFSEHRWSELVVYSLKAFLAAEISLETTPWSDEFYNLYHQYQSNLRSDNDGDDCLYRSFDTFLLSKFSQTPEWSDCIILNKSKILKEWCQAWKRLIDFNFNSQNPWKKTSTKQFHQDLKTFLKWLSARISIKIQKPIKIKNEYYGFIAGSHNYEISLFLKQEFPGFIKTLSLLFDRSTL